MKKTNKTFKRFAAITSASLLAACAVAPVAFNAFAEGEEVKTYTITINDNGNVKAENHTFNAYQIFTGDLSGSTLSNIAWGENVNSADFISDLTSNTTLNTITEISALKAGSTPSDVAKALAKIQDQSDNAEILAKIINDNLTGEAIATGSTSIEGLEAGYYFVKDADNSGEGNGDAKTKFILSVVKDTSVTLKTDAPTLEKKIWHNDTTDPSIIVDAPQGNSWGDVGDNQIGDKVYYYTKTSVPDMSDYDNYKYIIRDSMCSGLTMGSVTDVVYVNGDVKKSIKESADIKTEDDPTTTSFVETFYVGFDNLIDVIGSADGGGYIYTYYTATLNENAKVSDKSNSTQFNENKAYLEYSNNPNVSGDGTTGDNETGNTSEDIVYDWTFTTGAYKVDEADKAVPGAAFTLYEGSVAEGNEVKLTKITDPAQAGIEAATDTVYYIVDPNGLITQMDDTTATVNKFVILGLDDATTYKLSETKVPAGYNTCPDIDVSITAAYDTDGDTLTLTSNGSTNPIEIENKQGSVLPGTGGIGTTIFYLGGGAMAAIGGIYLISKRRMRKSEE